MAAALGYAYVLTGRLEEAESLLAEPPDATPISALGQGLRETYLAEGHLVSGCLDEAAVCAAHALRLARDRQERGDEAYALRVLAEIFAHRGGLTAEAHYCEAMAQASELGMRPLVSHCHFGLGKLYPCTGQREQAQEHLTAALTMYREMNMTYWLEQAEAEMRWLR